jgi:pimeloyl-ACP methyl ester carboxylesterase
VGLYEYGNPTGQPVTVFHGVPACGAGFVFADEPARDRRLRLIAPDRPGVGLSTAFDGWTVRSYPSMVTELADALDVDHDDRVGRPAVASPGCVVTRQRAGRQGEGADQRGGQ